MKWPGTRIREAGQEREAIAPLIISASRATDIPAFHMPWFMERLRTGWCQWHNPFNAAARQYVAFAQCRVIVFWTKNPLPLLTHIGELKDRGYEFYVQFSLNDYEAEGLEPGLPDLARRRETLLALSEAVGKERVVWRFDPIILGGPLCPDIVLERMERLAQSIGPYVCKCVFSFVDWYAKTARALKKRNPAYRPPDTAEMLYLARGMAQLCAGLPQPLPLAACAEALDLAPLGITPGACVDGQIIRRLCPHDAELARLCGFTPFEQGSLLPRSLPQSPRNKARDKGQRPLCTCVPSKDIGRYTTCGHGCVYCYAAGGR